MKILTVSFFGHRKISNISSAEILLEEEISKLIATNEYVDFLVGRDGEFDQLVSSVIKKTIKNHDYGNSSLILVLPYITAEYRNNEEYFHKYYNDIEICSQAEKCYFKAAIQIRNKSMIDRSDLVICCIERNNGGAYKSVQYAKNKGIYCVNIADRSNYKNIGSAD